MYKIPLKPAPVMIQGFPVHRLFPILSQNSFAKYSISTIICCLQLLLSRAQTRHSLRFFYLCPGRRPGTASGFSIFVPGAGPAQLPVFLSLSQAQTWHSLWFFYLCPGRRPGTASVFLSLSRAQTRHSLHFFYLCTGRRPGTASGFSIFVPGAGPAQR